MFSRADAELYVPDGRGVPEALDRTTHLGVGAHADDLELMAVYRLGYVPEERRRPRIDWSSSERKLPSQIAFRDTCETPQHGWDEPPSAAASAG